MQGAGTNKQQACIQLSNYSDWKATTKEDLMDKASEFFTKEKFSLYREVPKPEFGYVDPRVAF